MTHALRRRISPALLVAALVVLSAPDASANPATPVGRWVLETTEVRRVLVLRADATFQIDVRRGGTWRRVAGRYTAVGQRLSLRPDEGTATPSDATFTVVADRMTLVRVPDDGERMEYRRDQGPVVGRWQDASQTVALEFRADGTLERRRAGVADAGSYDVSYVEPDATRGHVVVRFPGQDPTPADFTLELQGRRIAFADPGAATPSIVLDRADPARADRPGDVPAADAPGEDPSTDFAGRWVGRTADGPVEFRIESSDGRLRIHAGDQTSVARITSPGRAEGSDPQEGGEIRFVLVRTGRRMVVRFTAVSDDGTRQELPEIVFDRAADAEERAPAPAPAASGFVGRWEARSDSGTAVLTVEDRGAGRFVLTSNGSSSVARLADDGSLVGEEVSDEGSVSFSASLSGDRLVLRVVVTGADGTRTEAPPVTFARAAAPRPGDASRDARLVGAWEYTSVQHFVIEYLLTLRPDGRYSFRVAPSDEGPENGSWRTADGRLYLHDDSAGAERDFGAYALTSDGSILDVRKADGSRRQYTRR